MSLKCRYKVGDLCLSKNPSLGWVQTQVLGANDTDLSYTMVITSGTKTSTQFTVHTDSKAFVRPRLKFVVGDRVYVKCTVWKRGEVSCAPYHPRNWTFDYSIRLDDGSIEYIPLGAGNDKIRTGAWGQMRMSTRSKTTGDNDNNNGENVLPNDTYPEWMTCSISLELMEDPVVASDGHTYSRSQIQHWFDSGKKTSPRTNIKFASLLLTPNWLAKAQIQEWLTESTTALKFQKQLTTLRGKLMNSKSSENTIDIVNRMCDLVCSAQKNGHCILAENEVKLLEIHMRASQCWTEDAMMITLNKLTQRCQTSVVRIQEKYCILVLKCRDLAKAKASYLNILKGMDDHILDCTQTLSSSELKLVQETKESNTTKRSITAMKSVLACHTKDELEVIKKWQTEGMTWALAGLTWQNNRGGLSTLCEVHLKNMRLARLEVDSAKKSLAASEKLLKEINIKLARATTLRNMYRFSLASANDRKQECLNREKTIDQLLVDYTTERDSIVNGLASVGVDVKGVDDEKNTTSFSSVVGSKRPHSSSSSSSSSPPSFAALLSSGNPSPAKRRKENTKLSPGDWLFEEGLRSLLGHDFVSICYVRGRAMIEAAATCGSEIAQAFCNCPYEFVSHELLSNGEDLLDDEWNGQDAYADTFCEYQNMKEMINTLSPRLKPYGLYMLAKLGLSEETFEEYWADMEEEYSGADFWNRDLQDQQMKLFKKRQHEYLVQSMKLGCTHAMIAQSKEIGSQRSLHAFWGIDDHSMNFAWMEKAAKLGNVEAMYETALMLHQGKEVTKSLNKARLYLLQACDQRHVLAKSKLQELDQELAVKERAAQATANEIAARALSMRMRESDY